MSINPQSDKQYAPYHDAWRSVRIFEDGSSGDVRLTLDFQDLPREDQALCVVTGMTVEDAVERQLSAGGECDATFVRWTMEEVYDAYNRFTIAMRGLKSQGLDWFADRTPTGPIASTLVPSYESLSFNAKEIDRRMVIIGLSKFAVMSPENVSLRAAQVDAESILLSVTNRTPYDYLAGYAIEASYDRNLLENHTECMMRIK